MNAFAATRLAKKIEAVIYTHDLDGRFATINRAGERLIGYSVNQLKSMTIFQLMVPTEAEKLQRKMNLKRLGVIPVPHELCILTKSGKPVTLLANLRLVYANGKAMVQGVARSKWTLQPAPLSPVDGESMGSLPEY